MSTFNIGNSMTALRQIEVTLAEMAQEGCPISPGLRMATITVLSHFMDKIHPDMLDESETNTVHAIVHMLDGWQDLFGTDSCDCPDCNPQDGIDPSWG
tara:strand:+ start:1113 stop:1406 length:294 start_codon:yes stop_codon:yes gene_type:complete